MIPNKNQIISGLVKIRDDRKFVLTNQHFFDKHWIQFNNKKGCFEYENGTFLGYKLLDVVHFYEGLLERECGGWLATASWYVKEK